MHSLLGVDIFSECKRFISTTATPVPLPLATAALLLSLLPATTTTTIITTSTFDFLSKSYYRLDRIPHNVNFWYLLKQADTVAGTQPSMVYIV